MALQGDHPTLQDYSTMNAMPEIWISVKKTNDQWQCKDPAIKLNYYWGFPDEKPVVSYQDDFNDITYSFTNNSMLNKTSGEWERKAAWVTQSVINSKDGKWSWALDDLKFDTVCQFRTQAVAKPEEKLNSLYESPAIFIPDGSYNYEQAVVNGVSTFFR